LALKASIYKQLEDQGMKAYPGNDVYDKIRWRVARKIMNLEQALTDIEGRNN